MSDFRRTVTNAVIDAIDVEKAPGRSTFLDARVAGHDPYNPVSEKGFRGANRLWLSLTAAERGYADARWLTYDQARRQGAFVREGERGTQIEYWDWMARLPVLDDQGDPKKDQDGNVITASILRDQPKVFYATVFNGDQIDGLDEGPDRKPAFDPIEKAKELIGPMAVKTIRKGDAGYDPKKDAISVPASDRFDSEQGYYAAVMHQLAYAAMHESRLKMSENPELRAEIVSATLVGQLGIGLQNEFRADHSSMIIEALREDHNEIFRACRDADQVVTWIMHPNRRQELERRAAVKAAASIRSKEEEVKKENRHYITVPFAEKDEARAAGARWDRAEKSWYVAKDSDLSKVAQWDRPPPTAENRVPPEQEFGEFCRRQGLVIEGEPIMDGRWHRVPVEGHSPEKLAGSYKGYKDGKPNGLVHNFRDGDSAVKWVATGVSLDAKMSDALQKQWEQRSQERSDDLKLQQEEAARKAHYLWQSAPWASPDHCPYLKKKDVGSYGVKQFDDGTVVIPARDVDGRIHSLQFVTNESKKFLTGGSKKGCYHTIDPGQSLGKGPIIVTEGYATGASIFEATGRPVIVAFDSGNLAPVAAALRGRYPRADIVLAADDDHQLPLEGKQNVGIDKSVEAAEKVKGHVIAVDLPDEIKAKGATDFDDLRREKGLDEVKKQIEGGLKAIRSKARAAGSGLKVS